MTKSKPRVVVAIEYYLPGFQAGGPMRSISTLVQQLSDEIDFYILTRDRDDGRTTPYPGIREGEWTPVGSAMVRYLAPGELTSRGLAAAVRGVRPDVLYFNGFFGSMSVKLLLARRLGGLRGIHVLLAPRGELSPGALRLKAFKKQGFLRFSRVTGLHREVVFHASTERESQEISAAVPVQQIPRIARNAVAGIVSAEAPCSKVSGAARFVFLSRIARKKNLHVAISFLRSLKGSVVLEIYGPVADEAYWRQCRALIGDMPSNVAVTYRGPLAHDRVLSTLSGHHFFLLPTASENFGHAIVEALLAGCPVVTSDQTPWLGLAARGVGWDLPLDDDAAWRRVLQSCVDLDAEAYNTASINARSFGHEIAATDTAAEHLHLFRSVFGVADSAGLP